MAGDLAAFDALYARYERRLFAFILRQLGEQRAAEDALHDTFMGLLRDREAGRSLRSLRAWLYQSARNVCLNRARSSRREAAALEVEARAPPAGSPSPEQAAEREQLATLVRKAVGRLPEALSELYHLRASGLSQDELAQVLNVPLGTVKSRMHELVNRLREELAA